MSIFFIIQTFIAVLIIGIALWAAFYLLKALLPYRKTMAFLIAVSIAGFIIYSQIGVTGKANDNGYVDTQKLFAKGGTHNESTYDKEYADNCRELPLYCYEMTSCSEAEEAFECGNYDLDRDGDGVPCESLCGSY
ncbi:excalibur calcium-binding domain-containing protein [Psychrobacter sp. UBA6291]|uniref:excalibur calcium-binding domain-containing protein n=1 Tax=Psychrobacter sp. UBA6291 TaxID=1947357 RepID=UPI00257CCDFE|nr:excalibur calcium-binding domain-containing protein [Psychrobacter sp. UBA6291]